MRGWAMSTPKSPFDNVARYYDTFFHRDQDYAADAREVRRKFPDARTVLEVGCGTGNLTVELVELGFEVTCIDPSTEMLRHRRGKVKRIINTSIQDYSGPDRFDLVLATHDVLNYVPFDEIAAVLGKIFSLGREVYVEVWDPSMPVYPFTYRRAGDCRRIRLGLGFNRQAHLLYILWGKGLVISYHHLYLHRMCTR